MTVGCEETPPGKGRAGTVRRCAGRAGTPSAAQLRCCHAGHSGPGPKPADGLPELRAWAPRNVSGQNGAGSRPGQGGEQAHKDCVHVGHKQAKARRPGTGCRDRGRPLEGALRSPERRALGSSLRFRGEDPVLPLRGLGLIPAGELSSYSHSQGAGWEQQHGPRR